MAWLIPNTPLHSDFIDNLSGLHLGRLEPCKILIDDCLAHLKSTMIHTRYGVHGGDPVEGYFRGQSLLAFPCFSCDRALKFVLFSNQNSNRRALILLADRLSQEQRKRNMKRERVFTASPPSPKFYPPSGMFRVVSAGKNSARTARTSPKHKKPTVKSKVEKVKTTQVKTHKRKGHKKRKH